MRVAPFWLAAGLAAWPAGAPAFEFSGSHRILVEASDGSARPIGTVRFRPRGDRIAFELVLDAAPFRDYFLSMKEFKCLEGATEILCHVPYPYPHPGTVTPVSLDWLEHALLFFYKTPADFGARLWNGIYFELRVVGKALVGVPKAVDLNVIGVPPDVPGVPPFGPGERHDAVPAGRWFTGLRIE
jgi:hypothetical protein